MVGSEQHAGGQHAGAGAEPMEDSGAGSDVNHSVPVQGVSEGRILVSGLETILVIF